MARPRRLSASSGPHKEIPMPVTKSQRALVVVNSLAKYSIEEWTFIYAYLEGVSVNLTQSMLGENYKFITVRKGADGTKAKFLNAIKAAATTPGIKAVDVFLQLHGTNNTFYFHDGPHLASVVRDDILALALPDRLRLIYNTSCFGDSQNDTEMIAAGFDTAIGSKKNNCTGITEFPTFCALWKAGHMVKNIMPIADNPLTRTIQDNLASNHSPALRPADSTKVIRGNKDLMIST